MMKKIMTVILMVGVLLVLSVGVVHAQSGFDSDGDGWADDMDNCPLNHNVSQGDADQDGIGDACEEFVSDAVHAVSYPSKLDCSFLFPEVVTNVHGSNLWACLMRFGIQLA
jgi:hypothetical protein